MVCLQIYTKTQPDNSYTEIFAQLYLKPLCETLQYSNHCVSYYVNLLKSLLTNQYFFQINFFLYAITGKAFRHELKRLFTSISVQMHLTKEIVPKPMDRRSTGFNANYLAGDTYPDPQLRERRPSPGTLHFLQSRQSIDSTISNGNLIPRHFRQQQSPKVQKNIPDVRYYIQRISAV
jgi:hypothetical protein